MVIRVLAAGFAALVALAAIEATIAAQPCAAGVIAVLPGIGTLQAAIDTASPGDELRLADGIYTGAVVIDKSLEINCDGATNLCIIDALCAAPIAVDVSADDVTIATKTAWSSSSAERLPKCGLPTATTSSCPACSSIWPLHHAAPTPLVSKSMRATGERP
jgi:nitrous oxidase accessory protein NosD